MPSSKLQNCLPCIMSVFPRASSGLLEHGNAGILVRGNDDSALAEALQRLILGPNLRKTLGGASKEISHTL